MQGQLSEDPEREALERRVDDLQQEVARLRSAMSALVDELNAASERLAEQSDLLALQDVLIGLRPQYTEDGEYALEVGSIAGATRVLGEGQGYRPLPVADVTLDGRPHILSAWELTAPQRAMVNDGAPLILVVEGGAQPPVMLSVGARVNG